jgi:hypothetical protein
MAKPLGYRRTFIRQWRQHRGLTLQRLAVASALRTNVAGLLMRDPTDTDAIWDHAKPVQRKRILEIANTIVNVA